jgi:hypothetical protein
MDCYNVFSPLHAYFLLTHGNGEVQVLGKLPYLLESIENPTLMLTMSKILEKGYKTTLERLWA